MKNLDYDTILGIMILVSVQAVFDLAMYTRGEKRAWYCRIKDDDAYSARELLTSPKWEALLYEYNISQSYLRKVYKRMVEKGINGYLVDKQELSNLMERAKEIVTKYSSSRELKETEEIDLTAASI